MSDNLIKYFSKPIHQKYSVGKKYINRELSWMEFNKRVLYQAMRTDIPLMERFNFLNITETNLEEFIMVRFASVMNATKRELSGMDPIEEYSAILESIGKFKDMQTDCFTHLIKKLESINVDIKKFKDLSKDQRMKLANIFYRNVYPVLTPMNFDTTKEYPELASKQLTIAVLLEDSDMQVVSFIPLDTSLDKMYKIPNTKNSYITVEELIYGHLDKIFYNKNIVDYGSIKLLREADIELDHNTDVYITERMKDTLLRRKYSRPIFMETNQKISKSFAKLLAKIFDLNKSHIYKADGPIDYSPYTSLLKGENKYRYKPFEPQFPAELIGNPDMFNAINENDIVLHHPYESYDPVVRFLEQSAEDRNVISIKQTLYRVSSSDSPIVDALCLAARNGKQVSVILEIKARFDEDRNISLIDKLRQAGCQLVYGVENLKTHCKFISVVRKEKNKLKIYSHMATGNYNEKTSKIYTDISYFTSNFKIGQDILTVFNMISGFSEPTTDINKIYFSPYNLRRRLIDSIDNEIKNAKRGKKAFITLKMNSICDKVMIDKLYEAADAGVKIIIICRGICSIKTRKNIRIKSIVGRFLEHSRIYYFYNNDDPRVYISSADLLTRNLDKRFELMLDVTDTEAKEKLLKILSFYFKDTFNSFEMDKESRFIKVKDEKSINIHNDFMKQALDNCKLKSIPKLYKKNK